MKREVVAVVPARGNSKGIPRKNITLFLGEPLIAHTIRMAKRARCIDRVIVSTESPEVSRVARRYGAEVLHRPTHLSRDDTPITPVIRDAMAQLIEAGCQIRAIVVLFPTAPLRTAADIEGAVAAAFRRRTYDSIAGVCEARVAPFGGLVERGGRLTYLVDGAQRMYQRQLAPPWFSLNGAIWVINPAKLSRLNLSLLGERSYGYVMPADRSVDIDTKHDWELAEHLARRRPKGRSRAAGPRA